MAESGTPNRNIPTVKKESHFFGHGTSEKVAETRRPEAKILYDRRQRDLREKGARKQIEKKRPLGYGMWESRIKRGA